MNTEIIQATFLNLKKEFELTDIRNMCYSFGNW